MYYLNYRRGALFALPGPIIGIAAWILLWDMSIIASVSSFLLAWLTVRLFKKGAGGIDVKSLYIILPYIAFGALAAFSGGMVADGLRVFIEHVDSSTPDWFTLLDSANFWDFMWANASTLEFWQGYGGDILVSVVFIGIGTYGSVRQAIVETSPAPQPSYYQRYTS